MDYIPYFFNASWPGYFSLLLVLMGIYLCRLPYLVQPVHGFKFRYIFGWLLIIAGITGAICIITISQKEITPDKYKELAKKAQNNQEVSRLINEYKHKKISEIEYFTLNRKIETMKQIEQKARQDKNTTQH